MNRPSTVSTITMVSLMMMIALALLSIHTEAAIHRCQPCPGGICGDLADCRHGVTQDNCGNLLCTRGPDEECGGPYNIRGFCGSGLICRCGRCVGCSTATMECSRPDSECNKSPNFMTR